MSGEIKKPKRGRVGPYFIKTDLKWKELVTWHDVPAKKRDFFDYLDEEERHEERFVSRYGDWLEVGNFERMAAGGDLSDAGWDGVEAMSAFSFYVIKIHPKDPSLVIIGYGYVTETDN